MDAVINRSTGPTLGTMGAAITIKMENRNFKKRRLIDDDDQMDDDDYPNQPCYKRRRLNHNKQTQHMTMSQAKTSILYQLPNDIFCHILEFSTIEDYAFSMLQISKRIHDEYNPFKKPFIIKHLIENEGKLQYFGMPFPENNQWNQLIKQNNFDISDYLKMKIKLTPIQSWQIAGHYAWKNHNKSFIPKKENEKYLKMLRNDHDLKDLSLKSGLFVLNFLYICRYGGIERVEKIKNLFAQCISTGKGALGSRIMFYFYWKEFFINIINERNNDIIFDFESGEMKPREDMMRDGDDKRIKLEDLLTEMFETKYEHKVFSFSKVMFKEKSPDLRYFDYDRSLSGINDLGLDVYWFHQMASDMNNWISNIMRKLIPVYGSAEQVYLFNNIDWWCDPATLFNQNMTQIRKITNKKML
mmetsp:Transcript_63215/g.56970  ORF Transcript_63215/g.56970 Transcript_63215/m.56970 type:complete len:413 (+) Transcript_63215:58-1296(+)